HYRSAGDRQKHEDCETDDKRPKCALRDMHGTFSFLLNRGRREGIGRPDQYLCVKEDSSFGSGSENGRLLRSRKIGPEDPGPQETWLILPLRSRDNCFHLVRIPALEPRPIDRCCDVIVRLARLYLVVDKCGGRIQRGIDLCEWSARNGRAVHVIAHHVRRRACSPREVDIVRWRRRSITC